MRAAWLLAGAAAAARLGSAAQTQITALEQVTAVLAGLKTDAQTAYEKASSDLGRLEQISTTMVNDLNTTLESTKVELTASEAAVQQYQVELDELEEDVEDANRAIIELEGQKEAEITNAAEAEKEYSVALAEYEAGERAVANAIQYLQAEQDAQAANADKLELVAAHQGVKKATANLTQAPVLRLLQQMPTVATRGSNWEADEHIFDDIDVAGLNKKYNFRSGSVLEALGGVQTSLTSEKESLIGAEVTRKENYKGMLASLEEQITTTRATYNKAIADRATKKTQYEEEEINRKNLAATVEADTAFLARTIEQFDAEKADYKQKAERAKGEVDAIDQALVAMAGVSGLGLVGVRSRLTIAGEPEDTASEVERVGSFLRTSAKRVDSSSLSRIADKAFEAAAAGDDDPLAEVKAMIEKLVMDLKAEEIKDTEQKAYCDE
jgi:chromosome segregation ATPase